MTRRQNWRWAWQIHDRLHICGQRTRCDWLFCSVKQMPADRRVHVKVDQYAWGANAFEMARREAEPTLLTVNRP